MTPIYRIAIWIPLAVGAVAAVGKMFIHALPPRARVDFVRYEKQLMQAGRGFWSDVGIVALVVSYALLAHLVEIALWGGSVCNLRRVSGVRSCVLPLCGQLHDFGLRRYRHHAVVEIVGTLGSGKWSAHVRRF